jgi:hypothetical protein
MARVDSQERGKSDALLGGRDCDVGWGSERWKRGLLGEAGTRGAVTETGSLKSLSSGELFHGRFPFFTLLALWQCMPHASECALRAPGATGRRPFLRTSADVHRAHRGQHD